jgi:hypothetical protein
MLSTARYGLYLCRSGRPEERHIPSPMTWLTVPVAVSGLHHVLEDRIEQLARFLGIAVGEAFHRALHARKEDRDLLSFTFARGLGGQDFPSELLGGIGVRRGVLRCGGRSQSTARRTDTELAHPGASTAQARSRAYWVFRNACSLAVTLPRNSVATLMWRLAPMRDPHREVVRLARDFDMEPFSRRSLRETPAGSARLVLMRPRICSNRRAVKCGFAHRERPVLED